MCFSKQKTHRAERMPLTPSINKSAVPALVETTGKPQAIASATVLFHPEYLGFSAETKQSARPKSSELRLKG